MCLRFGIFVIPVLKVSIKRTGEKKTGPFFACLVYSPFLFRDKAPCTSVWKTPFTQCCFFPKYDRGTRLSSSLVSFHSVQEVRSLILTNGFSK